MQIDIQERKKLGVSFPFLTGIVTRTAAVN